MQVGPHFTNVEILPIKLNKEGFIKLLQKAWERHFCLDNKKLVMNKGLYVGPSICKISKKSDFYEMAFIPKLKVTP